jgi:hypothetical protein
MTMDLVQVGWWYIGQDRKPYELDLRVPKGWRDIPKYAAMVAEGGAKVEAHAKAVGVFLHYSPKFVERGSAPVTGPVNESCGDPYMWPKLQS